MQRDPFPWVIEPEEREVWNWCKYCGGDIYVGDEYVDFNGVRYCSEECLRDDLIVNHRLELRIAGEREDDE